MSKLYCAYANTIKEEDKDIIMAVRQCDKCGKLLCRSCGFIENSEDFCNECWLIHCEKKKVKK